MRGLGKHAWPVHLCAAAACLGLAALASAETAAGPRLDSAPAATCTAAQKKRNAKALASFKKAMPKQRAAYFKRHKGAKQRRAYVRKQQAKLKALQRAAACRVTRVPGPPPPPPPPPPSPLASANLGVSSFGSRTGTVLRYDFTVRNYGPDTASTVLLSVQIPSGATLVSTTAGCTGLTTISCPLGTLAPQDAPVVSITVQAAAGVNSVTVNATVTSTTSDPFAGNNTLAATIGVPPPSPPPPGPPPPPPGQPPPPKPYTFFPQAGIVGQDLYINNFVDLDPSAGVQDWSCRGHSYDGHGGADADINSFREQEIGVPVFAALDGTVIAAHDGEPDMNTSASSARDNGVILDHGNSHHTVYGHFKLGSVAVTVGQPVVAGTQIGLTASSGSSTWPHLHFESRHGGAAYEPFSGPCRAGASGWLRQPLIRTDVFARDFTFSPNPFTGQAALPWDQAVRTGTFVAGMRTVHYRIQPANVPANSTRRIRFFRPDGSIAGDHSAPVGNSQAIRWGVWSFAWSLDLNQTGTWRLQLDVNSATIVDAPFTVVATPDQVGNRPPHAISVQFETPPSAGDVPVCQVLTSQVTEDPDYDIIRYRYRWTRNGSVVREVTVAARSDALPRGVAGAGDALACSVLPSDGLLNGPESSITATVTP